MFNQEPEKRPLIGNHHPDITFSAHHPSWSLAAVSGQICNIVFTSSGVITSASETVWRFFGYQPEAIVGQKIQEIILTSPYNKFFEPLIVKHETKASSTVSAIFVGEAIHRDGSLFPIRICQTPLTQVDGDVVVLAQVELLQRRTSTLIFDSVGIIKDSFNMEEFGFLMEELVDSNINSVLEDGLLLGSILERCQVRTLEYYPSPSMQGKGPEDQYSTSLIKKNGDRVPINMEVSMIHAAPAHVVFRATLEKLDFSLGAYLVLDEQNIVLECNQNFTRLLFGLSSSDLLGHNLCEFLPGLISNLPMAKRNSSTHQDLFKHKDGFVVPVEWTVVHGLEANSMAESLIHIRRVGEHSNLSSLAPLRKLSCKTIGRYIVQDTVGQGSSGKVVRAFDPFSQHQVAIKIIHTDKMEAIELMRVRREISILQMLRHPNIVKLHEAIETSNRIYLVMEYISGGDLNQRVLSRQIDAQSLHKYWMQLLSAVHYCHSLQVVHRDIKNTNILITSQGDLKLIDFGLATFEEGKFKTTFCGSLTYAAPEILLGKKYKGALVDVWSLGVVLYTMIYWDLPFKTLASLLAAEFTFPSPTNEVYTECLKRMLVVDPEKRSSLHQIYQLIDVDASLGIN